MKEFKFVFIILVLLMGVSACKKGDASLSDITVEQYIQLLKANKYDAVDLPAFTGNDIPALLKYVNESQLITVFPHNPISSFSNPNCKLGIYVLWTIESIRSAENSKVSRRFPSLNPIVALSSGPTVTDDQSWQAAVKAYSEWWENNKGKNFADFKNTDPLANTPYKWR